MKIENISLPVEHLFDFNNINSWVNHASSWCRPYKGEPLIMVTADGYLAHIGEDFMKANTNNKFPIKVYRAIRFAQRPVNNQE